MDREAYLVKRESQDERRATLHASHFTLHEPRTVRALISRATQQLSDVGIEGARQQAEWLLGRLMDARSVELYLEPCTVPPETVERFRSTIKARASGVPLQYLLGTADFCGQQLRVAPGVFIPRPETETIVEAAVEVLRPRQGTLGRPLRLLDLGTGSGCIAITLARRLAACVVVGVELSWNALQVACANVRRYGLESQVSLVQGRWLESIRGRFDGIISNPPYVPSGQVDGLPLEVRQEPRLSLDGGPDGLRELQHLLADAPRRLCPGGVVVLECGEAHVAPLCRMALSASWVECATPLTDLACRPRGVMLIGKSLS